MVSVQRLTMSPARLEADFLAGLQHVCLKAAQISETYSHALANGRRDGTGGLSPRSVGHMHRGLKQALGQAVRWELLIRNPAEGVDPPKVDNKPMQT